MTKHTLTVWVFSQRAVVITVRENLSWTGILKLNWHEVTAVMSASLRYRL